MTKLRVLAGTFDHVRAGDTFWPPHMRIGSSAAFLADSMPPSVKDGEVSTNGADAALPLVPKTAPAAVPMHRIRLLHLNMIALALRLPRIGNTAVAMVLQQSMC